MKSAPCTALLTVIGCAHGIFKRFDCCLPCVRERVVHRIRANDLRDNHLPLLCAFGCKVLAAHSTSPGVDAMAAVASSMPATKWKMFMLQPSRHFEQTGLKRNTSTKTYRRRTGRQCRNHQATDHKRYPYRRKQRYDARRYGIYRLE